MQQSFPTVNHSTSNKKLSTKSTKQSAYPLSIDKSDNLNNKKNNEKHQRIQKNQSTTLPSLTYLIEQLKYDTIKQLNRLQLFEILYQVQQQNTRLKEINNLQKLTTNNVYNNRQILQLGSQQMNEHKNNREDSEYSKEGDKAEDKGYDKDKKERDNERGEGEQQQQQQGIQKQKDKQLGSMRKCSSTSKQNQNQRQKQRQKQNTIPRSDQKNITLNTNNSPRNIIQSITNSPRSSINVINRHDNNSNSNMNLTKQKHYQHLKQFNKQLKTLSYLIQQQRKQNTIISMQNHYHLVIHQHQQQIINYQHQLQLIQPTKLYLLQRLQELQRQLKQQENYIRFNFRRRQQLSSNSINNRKCNVNDINDNQNNQKDQSMKNHSKQKQKQTQKQRQKQQKSKQKQRQIKQNKVQQMQKNTQEQSQHEQIHQHNQNNQIQLQLSESQYRHRNQQQQASELQDQDQIDLILEQLYNQVKQVMTKNEQ